MFSIAFSYLEDWFSLTVYYCLANSDEEMEDITSKGKTPSPKKKTASSKKESPVAAKESSKTSLVAVKDPKKIAADQKNARIAGVVTLVAAEFQVTVSEVQKTINVELGYEHAKENNLELFDTLKNGYKRCVTVTDLVRTVAKNLGADYNADLVNCTNWIAVYDEARQQSADPLTAMTKHFQGLQSKESSTKPKRGLTLMQQDRLERSAFNVDTAEMKANRQRTKETRENKAREKKVAAARNKAAGEVDAAAVKQLGSDDDDDDDLSIGDMMLNA